jgi:hypothetical protein
MQQLQTGEQGSYEVERVPETHALKLVCCFANFIFVNNLQTAQGRIRFRPSHGSCRFVKISHHLQQDKTCKAAGNSRIWM